MHKNNLKVCEWIWLILNEYDCIIIITKRSWSQKGEAMIYTVTFNPSLDYIVEVNDFELGMILDGTMTLFLEQEQMHTARQQEKTSRSRRNLKNLQRSDSQQSSSTMMTLYRTSMIIQKKKSKKKHVNWKRHWINIT